MSAGASPRFEVRVVEEVLAEDLARCTPAARAAIEPMVATLRMDGAPRGRAPPGATVEAERLRDRASPDQQLTAATIAAAYPDRAEQLIQEQERGVGVSIVDTLCGVSYR